MFLHLFYELYLQKHALKQLKKNKILRINSNKNVRVFIK